MSNEFEKTLKSITNKKLEEIISEQIRKLLPVETFVIVLSTEFVFVVSDEVASGKAGGYVVLQSKDNNITITSPFIARIYVKKKHVSINVCFHPISPSTDECIAQLPISYEAS